MYINAQNQLYIGDMAIGDREATPEEIAAWEISRLPTAIDQIRALEQTHIDDQRKLNRQAAIDTALTVACRSPAAEGKTRDEVHAIYYASNRGYRAMVDLEAQIAELRKQL
jgi:hypothetical protein